MAEELRPVWRRWFGFNWKFGFFLLLLVCVPRFLLVLHANTSGSYGAIGIVMFLSALAPFVFLNRNGLREIGWRKPAKPGWLLIALLTGLAFSLVLHLLGQALYGTGLENWYVYIARSYRVAPDLTAQDKLIYFSIFALTGMSFSPIGEELFFRGIVHSSFVRSLGHQRASLADATAFALVHLSHFGIVFLDGRWQFFPLPALLWVLSMFLVSLLFFTFRQRSGSILGAILCHAGFNLGMIYAIFYLL